MKCYVKPIVQILTHYAFSCFGDDTNATDGGTDAEPRLNVSWEYALHFIEEAYRPEIVQVIVIQFVQPEEALTVTHRMRSLG